MASTELVRGHVLRRAKGSTELSVNEVEQMSDQDLFKTPESLIFELVFRYGGLRQANYSPKDAMLDICNDLRLLVAPETLSSGSFTAFVGGCIFSRFGSSEEQNMDHYGEVLESAKKNYLEEESASNKKARLYGVIALVVGLGAGITIWDNFSGFFAGTIAILFLMLAVGGLQMMRLSPKNLAHYFTEPLS